MSPDAVCSSAPAALASAGGKPAISGQAAAPAMLIVETPQVDTSSSDSDDESLGCDNEVGSGNDTPLPHPPQAVPPVTRQQTMESTSITEEDAYFEIARSALREC